MNDLLVASLTLGGCCLSALYFGAWIGKQEHSRFRTLVLSTSVLVLAFYLICLWNQPILVRLFPTSGLIILANWLPCWGAFVVGVYARSKSIPGIRRTVVCIVTVLLATYSSIAPMTGSPPTCSQSGDQSHLQSQTNPFTCSAAAAATVLRLHGIHATEAELATLCLTREGTHWLGVYRGLKLKTRNSPWDVAVESFNEDALNNREGLPCIMSIDIDTSKFRPEMDHGFLEGTGHSVVYLCRESPSRITVFDPSPGYGVERWNSSILNCITGGVILRLIPRSNTRQHVINTSRERVKLSASTRLAARL